MASCRRIKRIGGEMMVKYQKGKSCIQLGKKHSFKESGTGRTQHCTKCGSVRGMSRAKVSKAKAKKVVRKAPAVESKAAEE